jgi:hypothetical protein
VSAWRHIWSWLSEQLVGDQLSIDDLADRLADAVPARRVSDLVDKVGADTGFRARHAGSFERVAVVSDEDWIRPAMRGLSFLLPGKARGFPVRDLAAAKEWLAEGLRG